MATINLPSTQNLKSIEEVINVVEILKKELDFALSSIDIDNMNNNYVAIVESGTNSNGTYRKYSDGTLECYFTSSIPANSLTWSTATINGTTYYYTGTTFWTYPIPFLTGSTVNVMASGDIQLAAPETHIAWHVDNMKCRTESGAFGINPTTVSGAVVRASFFARGVWK